MMALQLTALFCFLTASQTGFVNAFRSDYTFIESTHSYYKLYKEAKPWNDAKSKCESEGAVLFHPDNKAELLQVFNVLDAHDSWIATGLSNLRDANVFETVDGRLDNQVYNAWRAGYPMTRNTRRCGFINFNDHDLTNGFCSNTWPYICKHSIKYVDTIIGNASLKIADLERQLTKQSLALANSEQIVKNHTAELEALKQQQQQETNQPSVLEALTKTMANQTLTLQQIADAEANQVAALERLTANQAAAMQQEKETTIVQGATQNLLDRLMGVFANEFTTMHQQNDAMKLLVTKIDATIDRQATAMDRQVSAMDRQTAVMDRQVQLLEKLVLLQDNNDLFQERSDQ